MHFIGSYCTDISRCAVNQTLNLSSLSCSGRITAKAALKFGSEAWVLKKREEQRLEAAQMKFLRHLLGITKLDKEKHIKFIKYINPFDNAYINDSQEEWLI